MGVVKHFDHNFGDITISDNSNYSGVNLALHSNTSLESDMLMNPSCQYKGGGYSILFPVGDDYSELNNLSPGGLFFKCSNCLYCNVIWHCFSPERHSGDGSSECFVIPHVYQGSTSASVTGGLLAIQPYGMILMIMAFWWC